VVLGTVEKKSRPILVTGAHRSGTTWVGKMLAASPEVAYLSEPLNVWHRPGVMRAQIHYWYTYICEENQNEYLPELREMFGFEYHTWREVKSIRSVKDLFRMGRDWEIFWSGRRKHQTPLIKDPFALFSAEWFASCLNCQVVIIVRHPAAVASSLSRLGWSFDFSDLLNQPLLMRDWLEPFETDLEKMLDSAPDVIAQSSLLWRILYQVVISFQDRQPNFVIIRHEDISNDPMEQFKQLYQELGLKFSTPVGEIIKSASSASNPKQTSPQKVHSVQVDSRANIKQWQQQMTKADIDRVRKLTSDVAPQFYSDEDWY
jgi:hypothetical protein